MSTHTTRTDGTIPVVRFTPVADLNVGDMLSTAFGPVPITLITRHLNGTLSVMASGFNGSNTWHVTNKDSVFPVIVA